MLVLTLYLPCPLFCLCPVCSLSPRYRLHLHVRGTTDLSQQPSESLRCALTVPLEGFLWRIGSSTG